MADSKPIIVLAPGNTIMDLILIEKIIVIKFSTVSPWIVEFYSRKRDL